MALENIQPKLEELFVAANNEFDDQLKKFGRTKVKILGKSSPVHLTTLGDDFPLMRDTCIDTLRSFFGKVLPIVVAEYSSDTKDVSHLMSKSSSDMIDAIMLSIDYFDGVGVTKEHRKKIREALDITHRTLMLELSKHPNAGGVLQLKPNDETFGPNGSAKPSDLIEESHTQYIDTSDPPEVHSCHTTIDDDTTELPATQIVQIAKIVRKNRTSIKIFGWSLLSYFDERAEQIERRGNQLNNADKVECNDLEKYRDPVVQYLDVVLQETATDEQLATAANLLRDAFSILLWSKDSIMNAFAFGIIMGICDLSGVRIDPETAVELAGGMQKANGIEKFKSLISKFFKRNKKEPQSTNFIPPREWD